MSHVPHMIHVPHMSHVTHMGHVAHVSHTTHVTLLRIPTCAWTWAHPPSSARNTRRLPMGVNFGGGGKGGACKCYTCVCLPCISSSVWAHIRTCVSTRVRIQFSEHHSATQRHIVQYNARNAHCLPMGVYMCGCVYWGGGVWGMQCVEVFGSWCTISIDALTCNVLQCVAVCCSVL